MIEIYDWHSIIRHFNRKTNETESMPSFFSSVIAEAHMRCVIVPPVVFFFCFHSSSMKMTPDLHQQSSTIVSCLSSIKIDCPMIFPKIFTNPRFSPISPSRRTGPSSNHSKPGSYRRDCKAPSDQTGPRWPKSPWNDVTKTMSCDFGGNVFWSFFDVLWGLRVAALDF